MSRTDRLGEVASWWPLEALESDVVPRDADCSCEVPDVDCRKPPALQSRQAALSGDLTDEEWAHIEPLIPPAKRGGGKRRVNMREVVNGVMYVLSTGCQWRALPKDLPQKHRARLPRPVGLGRAARSHSSCYQYWC